MYVNDKLKSLKLLLGVDLDGLEEQSSANPITYIWHGKNTQAIQGGGIWYLSKSRVIAFIGRFMSIPGREAVQSHCITQLDQLLWWVWWVFLI